MLNAEFYHAMPIGILVYIIHLDNKFRKIPSNNIPTYYPYTFGVLIMYSVAPMLVPT